MDILIIRDGGATKIQKQVGSMDEVRQLRSAGFEVEVIGGEPAEPETPPADPETPPADPETPPADPEV